MLRSLAICTALIIATIAAYWPVREYPFVRYDDETYVTGREIVLKGLTADNIVWSITTDATGTWHPLAWWSHMLDCDLYRQRDGTQWAGGHHLTSVILHVIAMLVLFALMNRLTNAIWPSAFIAAVFALHPQRVESVAWIAERKDVLCVVFSLITVHAYIGWAQRGSVWRYLLMMLAFVFALLAKPMAVTVPALLLLLDFWPLGRVWKLPGSLPMIDGSTGSTGSLVRTVVRLVVEKLPLFALSAADTVITIIVQTQIGSIENLERLSLVPRLGNAVVSYVRYLEKLFWPVDLVVLYPHPGHWPLITVLGSLALLVVITIICAQYAKTRPYLLFGWLWFVVAMLPVIGVVQTGYQAMADRYSYLPSVGLLLAITLLLRDLLSSQPKWIMAAAASALVCVLGVLSRMQLQVWSSTESLYRHAVESSTDNWAMCMLLGGELERQQRFTDATPYLAQAARLRNGDPVVIARYADNLQLCERYPEMIAELRRALAIDPDHVQSLNNLAYFLAVLVDHRLRNPTEALTMAEHAAFLTKREDPNILDTLATVYAANGRTADAVRTAEQARDIARAKGMEKEALAFEARAAQLRAGRIDRIGPPNR